MFTLGNSAASIQSQHLIDFGRQMSPTVLFQDRVIKVLDAQAQTRHADLFERLDLGFGQRARLAFERDFFGLVPTDVGSQAIDQRVQLLAQLRNDGVPPPK